MPAYDYAFAGGTNLQSSWGDRWVVSFGGTWASGDHWTILATSTVGDFTLGEGNVSKNATVCFTYRNRVYIGLLSQWNFSDNNDPASWEEQNPGAGFLLYLSQFGSQDSIAAFGQLQGRLAVIARRSIQLWSVDADPSQFANIQTLDNVGSLSALAVQQVGDFDVLFLDDTGIRSLRSREVTLNAYVDDIGTPIDKFVRAGLIGLSDAQKALACATVEPTTKNFWLFLKDTIYVLARHPGSKVSAWSTYEPRGDNNVVFTPQKFAVYQGRVYCRSVERGFYTYGGVNNTTYDKFTPVTFITPFLDDKRPGMWKNYEGLQAVMQSKWVLSVCADPQSDTYVDMPAIGNADTPNELTDSTYDLGSTRVPLKGTHFSIQGVSQAPAASVTTPAKFGQFLLFYNLAESAT